MRVLSYEGLDTAGLEAQVRRVTEALERGDFHAAQMKKLEGSGFYRAELGRKDRLLVQLRKHRGDLVVLLLEVIRNHAYQDSRFLGGGRVDEARIVDVTPAGLESGAHAELAHLPAKARTFSPSKCPLRTKISCSSRDSTWNTDRRDKYRSFRSSISDRNMMLSVDRLP